MKHQYQCGHCAYYQHRARDLAPICTHPSFRHTPATRPYFRACPHFLCLPSVRYKAERGKPIPRYTPDEGSDR
ncbi:MAG: hypothetical protein LIO91_08145 [Bacteroidales bacterium]|nr:hypothetical protein [Bacteroidales bacterium]